MERLDVGVGTVRSLLEDHRSTVGLDEATWARARGWALWKAALTLGDPGAAVAGRQSAQRLIDDLLALTGGAESMSRILRFDGGVRRDPAIEAWMRERPGELGARARRWFEVMRGCGDDVREMLHDGHPTACIGDAAFGYVNVFTAHLNVGFFRGAELPDPKGLLAGSGKFMRHVKLGPGREVDEAALEDLIEAAYRDMKQRLRETS